MNVSLYLVDLRDKLSILNPRPINKLVILLKIFIWFSIKIDKRHSY